MTRSKRKNAYIAIAIIGVLAIIGVTFASIFRAQKESELSIYPVSLNATMQMSESLDDVVIGETVIDKISFTRNNDSLDSFVRIGVSYYKDGALTDDDKRFLLGANYEDITTSSDGSTYMWTRGEDGYYYLTDLSGNPIKVASTSEYVFCENVAYTGAPSLYQTIPAPTGLKLKADIQAINAKSLTTPSIDELSTVFLDNFGSEPVYGYIVTFDTGDANAIVAQTFLSINQTVTKPSDPILMGHEFNGWYTDSQFQNLYNFDTPVTSSFTLYAKFSGPIRVVENGQVIKEVQNNEYTLQQLILSDTELQNKYNFYNDEALADSIDLADVLIDGQNIYVQSATTVQTSDTAGVLYTQINDSTYRVGDNSYTNGNAYNGADTEIVLLNNYFVSGVVYPVTGIGQRAFRDNSALTSVTIPDSVTSIGSSAFYGCSGLISITIPNDVTSIGAGTFFYCRSLTNIYYNATNCNDVSSGNEIFSDAGQGGEGITIYIGANVERIPGSLFTHNVGYGNENNIISVKFAAGSVCKEIGNWAFYDCHSLTEISIPSSVTSIGISSFYGCFSLTKITIPASVTSIGVSAFDNCYKLVQIRNLSGQSMSLRSILGQEILTDSISTFKNTLSESDDGKYQILTVGDKKYLMGFTATADRTTANDIPNDITDVYQYSFSYCRGLTSITIPDNVTGIGHSAFFNSGLSLASFGNATGWYYTSTAGATSGGTALTISATDTAANATLLKSTYASYYWYRV